MKAMKTATKAMKATRVPKIKKSMKARKAMKAMKAKKPKPKQTYLYDPFLFDNALADGPSAEAKELLRRVGVALDKFMNKLHDRVRVRINRKSPPQGHGYPDDQLLTGALLDSGITLSLDRYSFAQ